ncbi:MAG TPA: hypothetical protein VF263_20515 [Longimicrobiaceae bacterium]
MATTGFLFDCARTFGLPFAVVWAVGDYINAYELSMRGFTDWGVLDVLSRAFVTGLLLGTAIGYVWKQSHP